MTARVSVSEIATMLAQRGGPQVRAPTIELERARTSTSAAGEEWTKIAVSVPVCDEYPTAQEAVDACVRIYNETRAIFPMPAPQNGGTK